MTANIISLGLRDLMLFFKLVLDILNLPDDVVLPLEPVVDKLVHLYKLLVSVLALLQGHCPAFGTGPG